MKVPTLIAGGGLTGLSCARTLAESESPYLLVERERNIGGLCRTVLKDGFAFDYTGHFLHFHRPEIKDWVLSLADNIFKTRQRHAVIYSHRTYSEYPYQENNSGLPSDIVRENVMGYLEAMLRSGAVGSRGPSNFKNWCQTTLGEGISKNFMFPYNRKLWKTPPEVLTTRWMGRFVPTPRILEVLDGAFARRPSASGYNSSFLYPDQGGISVLPRTIGQGLPNLWNGVGLRALSLKKKKAWLSSGLEVDYRVLVSSLPLDRLCDLALDLPKPLYAEAKRLKATSIYNINLGIRGRQPIPFTWVYFPEEEFLFHRAGSVSACVPTVAPKGCYSLYVEFSYQGPKPDPEKWYGHAVQKLVRLGWIGSKKDVIARVDLNLPRAYVVYDQGREGSVRHLLEFLKGQGVHSTGRYGRWEYGSMESAIAQGIDSAKDILAVN
jgi:protoporphyrinogen oxidase